MSSSEAQKVAPQVPQIPKMPSPTENDSLLGAGEHTKPQWPTRGAMALLTLMVAIVGMYAAVNLMIMMRAILQPFLFAIFLIMIINPFKQWMDRNFLCCYDHPSMAPRWLKYIVSVGTITISLVVLGCVVVGVIAIVIQSLVDMKANLDIYQQGAIELTKVSTFLH